MTIFVHVFVYDERTHAVITGLSELGLVALNVYKEKGMCVGRLAL